MCRAEAALAITADRDCRADTQRHRAKGILLLDRGGHCWPIVSLLGLVIPADIADQVGVQGRHPLRRRAAPLLIFWDVGYLICYEGYLDWCFMESNAPSNQPMYLEPVLSLGELIDGGGARSRDGGGPAGLRGPKLKRMA